MIYLRLAALAAFIPCIQAAWQPSGPYGGSSTAIAIHPQNSSILVAGARNSLIYRSADGGQTWWRLPFPRFFMANVSALLIDPAQPKRYYAGLANDFSPEAGVWISDDEGLNWRRPASLNGLSVYALAQWAKDPRRLVAGTRDGVWVSDDSGESWRRISKPYNHELRGVTAVAFDPEDKRIIYAGTTHLPWKTLDEGQTWVSIHDGMVDDTDVFSIFVDPKKPERVFASACSGIYLSDTNGDTWNKVRGIPGTHRRTHVIRLHPVKANVIYAGTTLGLLKSTDNGATFRKMNDLHVLSMAFDAKDPETFWIAAEGSGLWQTTDGGATLSRRVEGFVNRRVVDVAWSAGRSWATTVQDGETGGLYASDNGGEGWELRASASRMGDQHLNLIAADPARPEVLLAGRRSRLLRTADGGKTWKPVTGLPKESVIQALAAVRYGENYERTAFMIGTPKGLFRSLDSGLAWKPVQLTLAKITPDVKALRTSPSGARVVVQTAHTLYLTNNGGDTWWNLPVLIPTSVIYDIAIGDDPSHPILIATAKGMHRSSDSGRTWTPVIGGLEEGTVSSVAFQPGDRGVAFASQFGRLYLSEDKGKTWRPIPDGVLLEATIRRLWFHPGHEQRLLALTPDLGVFYLDLNRIAVHNR